MRNLRPERIGWIAVVFALAGCEAGGGGQALADYPDAGSPGFAVFSRYCSDCHRPPVPARHDAAGWDRVLRRMQQHRVDRGLGAIPADELEKIRVYLHAHAGAAGA